MRLTHDQTEFIRSVVRDTLGDRARIVLFGSRVDDHARGGDVDLLIQVDHPIVTPALIIARIGSRISRGMQGRRVDVILDAPNLARQPIFDVALQAGVVL